MSEQERVKSSTLTDQKLDLFPAFAKIWACATLIHQLAFTFWCEAWPGWVLVLATIAVLFQPACLYRFAWLVVASLINLVNKLPFVPNHILFEGMLHIIMVLALIHYLFTVEGKGFLRDAFDRGWKSRLLIAVVIIKAVYHLLPFIPKTPVLGAITTACLVVGISINLFGRGPVRSGNGFLNSFAPVIRAAVIMMYFWAVLQKLNHDYLNPELSCAGVLHSDIAKYFGELVPTKPWALNGAIWGSLTFELGIPILLMIPRTRFLGFLAAVFFHLWLSIHPAAGIYSFSSLILAALYLFLPVGMWRNLMSIFETQLRKIGGGDLAKGRKVAAVFVLGFFFAILITQIYLYLSRERSYGVFHIANRFGFIAFAAWGIWIGICYALAALKNLRGGLKESYLPNKAAFSIVWLGLLFIILNGVSPWIGGKTQTSFSMYSNLRTEGVGNHLFMKRIDLMPFQEDLVKIIEVEPNLLDPSNRPKNISNFANPGHKVLPYFEFRRLVTTTDEQDFSIIYEQGGEQKQLIRSGDTITGDEGLLVPIPLVVRKVLWFRRLNAMEGPMPCTH